MADELLVQWGKNIALTRELRTPDGGLRRVKAMAGMSQEDLGLALDPPVRQATVSRWERGLMEPGRKYKIQIASVLSVDASSLFPLTRVAA